MKKMVGKTKVIQEEYKWMSKMVVMKLVIFIWITNGNHNIGGIEMKSFLDGRE